MIYKRPDFVFEAPAVVSRARRVLIKPCASYASPYPETTSPQMLATIIAGIRQISDADILILEGNPDGEPMQPIYQSLAYDFPRVLMLDVKGCISVEVDNPLTKPYVIPTFWIPNVILSSDYLISVSPLQINNGVKGLSIMNLLSLLPSNKYQDVSAKGADSIYNMDINKVLADLYFTLPFDLGIIETEGRATENQESSEARRDTVFVGEPYELDREVAQTMGIKAEYLDLINLAKVDLEA